MKTIGMALALLMAATPASAAKPERVTVLTGKAMATVLGQCSRDAPAKGQGWFRPTPAQIAALDRAAAIRLTAADGRPKAMDAASVARGYAVEVVGIVRGGRRFVYGNYYPLRMQEGVKDGTVPTVVCDGGPSFFGVEIDAATGRLTHFATNGRV